MMKSSKSERGNLQKVVRPAIIPGFEDNSTNKKTGGGVGRA